ncbi:nucleotide pyrophosphohydrolase [Arthrobacter sp. MYb211]|uniref:MazG nucleotide pyrophosphohydrolase domain-containing protein n=1 Tax=unclassified Arthrobacter TaxID=235627 RepID=UPI000CFAA47B|nr:MULTISPECIES: MazG nucleotide pyrophosphohydrolase domain-containing protein [unclassified Arthrobacter]PRA09996.1 nucleotide pyrophosphohydrolase [Arthrobacter sp. MYb221]PRC05076.1 nucleotide pyrophosphohydrolase [Arthrobacter sp. MYb211]
MQSESELDRLIWIVGTLRERCAWTGALTHESLRTYLIEESYEVLDAIGAQDAQLLCEELGDLLFQILLHARIAEEREHFGLQEVAKALADKLQRRNRHVFDAQGGLEPVITTDIAEIIRIWDAAKQSERAGAPRRKNAGLPAGLPSLALAQKLLDRHRRAGAAKLPEPTSEIRGRVHDAQSLSSELLALSARAEELGLDAETVLRDALAKNYAGTKRETTSP